MSACTFFGHHDCPLSIRPKLRELLIGLMEEQSVDMFYVGNQGAFDRLVASVLRELAQEYAQIRYAIVWRNRWMLSRSDFVVTYVTHSWGGAAQFAAQAEKQGKIVYNIADNPLTMPR